MGPSDTFNGYFYKELLQNPYHQLGRAVYDSKANLVSSSLSHGSYRWLMFGLNALCDPEMPVYISPPLFLENVNISYNHGDLSMSTNVNDCKICITSLYDYGENYFFVVDSVNTYSDQLSAGAYRICVTKAGYIPYIAYVGDNLYIQNENFIMDTSIQGDNVYAGSNVTALKENGSVIVSSGRTIIKGTNKTTIKGVFKVDRGASFEVH